MTASNVEDDMVSVNRKRLASVLSVMARAACQDFGQSIDVDETVDDAFLEVELGLNILLEDLARAKTKGEEQLREIERKAALAEEQARVLSELATPIIVVGQGVLALPVIGTVDTERAADMMEKLLHRVAFEPVTHVIIDITGVSVVDTRTAAHFIRLGKAVRLIGAECFLTGMGPAIAQTVAQLGVDTSSVRTMRTLADALKSIQKAALKATA